MISTDKFLFTLIPNPTNRLALLRAMRSEPPKFSWIDLERRAISWGLAPLIHHRLTETNLLADVPAPIAQHLAEIKRYTAVRNTLFDHALDQLAAAFTTDSIPLIVLKGGDLMRTVYPSRSLRISLDLDLMVKEKDIPAAEIILTRAGYVPAHDMSHEWFADNLHHGIPWKSPDGGLVIELHWTLVRKTDPFRVDVPLLWSRARTLHVRRASALRLSLPDTIEYLAVHVFRHLTAPDGALRSLADMALVLDHPENQDIDWQDIRTGARARGTSLPLALSLDLLGDLWPERGLAPLAQAFRQDVNDPHLYARSRRLAEGLFRLPSHQPPAIVSGLMRLGQEKGASGKMAFLAGGLFPNSRDMVRDLTRDQARLPAPLRYPSLLFNYMKELARLGPRAAIAAYRLGQVRQSLEDARKGSDLGNGSSGPEARKL